MYGFIAMASRYFMTASHWNERITDMLNQLRLVTSAYRVSLSSLEKRNDRSPQSGFRLHYTSKVAVDPKKAPSLSKMIAALNIWLPELSENRTVRAGERHGRKVDDRLEGLKSLIAIPVFAENKLMGVLLLEFLEPKRWHRMEYRLIRHFTQMLASAINRQKLLKAIKVDKRYFEELFHSSPFGIAILNEEGRVQHINNCFTEIFGYRERDLLGKKLDDILPAPEERESAMQHTERSLAGEEVSFEATRYRKDGSPINVSILGRHLHPTPSQSAVFSIYIDITDRVKAQRHSAENRKKYQGLFEMSNDGICIMEKGIFIEANEKMPLLFGCSMDQVIGSSIFDFSPEVQPDGQLSHDKGISFYREALSGTPVTFEWMHKRADGSSFYGEVSLSRFELGGNLYAQGILRDISARKAIEESMKKRYDFFNYLSRASSDLINLEPGQIDSAIVETLKHAANFADCEYAQVFLVRFAEQKADLVYSWTAEGAEMIDDKIRQLEISDFSLIHEYLKVGNTIQAKRSSIENTFDKNQVEKYLDPLHVKSIIIIPMLVNNRYIGHIGFHNSRHELTWPDETLNSLRLCSQMIANAIGRKQVIRELEEAKKKAEESDRLKTAFLASMSHEIRTPMNHIIGFIELLKDPSLSEIEKSDFFSIIRNSGNHLLKLIDDIIDIAKIEANQLELHPVETSLNDFLKEQYIAFKEQLNNGQKKPVDFSLHLPNNKGSDYVKLDTFRLQQVLTNLLANSIKFTREGRISFGYELLNERTLRFFVEDTGIGIPEENQQLIFERFRQLDYSYSREFSGTGLGLAISKGLVELLGGQIWVESVPAKGSTFYFTIPYSPLSPVEHEEATIAKTTGDYNFEGKTILVVEDDEINFRFLEIMLSRTKASIIHANNGQSAYDLAVNGDVDLVLMDIQIPVIDGYTATRMIKEAKPHLPVIAQTAHALDDEKNECLEAGADSYVAKPINRKQLLIKISNLLLRG